MWSCAAFVLTPSLARSNRAFRSNRTFRPLRVQPHRARRRAFVRPGIPTCTQQQTHETPDTDTATTPSSPPPDDTPKPPPPLSRTVRWVLGALSLTGCIETAYLTFVKLAGTAGKICATQGCLDVLSGPWSSVLGIPLSAFGLLAYGSFCFLSVWPLFAGDEEVYADVDAGATEVVSAEEVYLIRDRATRPLLAALGAALVVFSSYLMALLLLVIRDMCPYCVFSAGLTAAIFLTTTAARAAPPRVAASGAGLALAAAGLSYALATPYVPPVPDAPQAPPAVTQRSSPDALRIARKLRAKGTKMYGAYWCTHCYDQKQRLGKRAWAMLEYVECDRHGVDSQMNLCRSKRIPGYPTWEIDGKLYPGEIRLEDLEIIAEEE